MANHGTLETIFVMVVPLVFWFLVLANLPAIIGGLLCIPLGIIMIPFILVHLAYRDWYESRQNKKSQQNNNKQEYQKEYKPKDEPKPHVDRRYELYDLLGVNFNATRAEIRAAFKNKMMMNHPDKLSTLDPELQRFAMERTIAIKDAYERLSASIH